MFININYEVSMSMDHQPQFTRWIGVLTSDGSRITPARKAVIEILLSSPCALDAAQIYMEARETHPKLGLMTVYRTLEKLEEAGLIQRVHQPGGCHMYFAAPSGHQHLLLCTGCGRVEFFSGDDLEPLFNKIGRGRSYDIQDHWLQLFGVCKQCLSKETDVS
jgi:Fe2+ or Zn2+ uptake regulation protein